MRNIDRTREKLVDLIRDAIMADPDAQAELLEWLDSDNAQEELMETVYRAVLEA